MVRCSDFSVTWLADRMLDLISQINGVFYKQTSLQKGREERCQFCMKITKEMAQETKLRNITREELVAGSCMTLGQINKSIQYNRKLKIYNIYIIFESTKISMKNSDLYLPSIDCLIMTASTWNESFNLKNRKKMNSIMFWELVQHDKGILLLDWIMKSPLLLVKNCQTLSISYGSIWYM